MSTREGLMEKILNELKEIIKTKMLPDGDHIDISTSLYLEGLLQAIQNDEQKAETQIKGAIMEHTIVFWSKTKEPDEKGSRKIQLLGRTKLSEKEITDFALKEYMESNSRITGDREYWAEIESTVHD